MPSVCFYFQVHQPKRLRNYHFFDIGKQHCYEDEELNRDILLKVAKKCYLPTNALMLELIKKHQGRFKIAYSISGTAIEQFKKHSPETLDSFKRLADTGCVEMLNETYYHSLSFLYSQEEFLAQIKMHRELIEREFGQKSISFRNTELIYNNDLGKLAESLGYRVVLAEGAEKVLGWRSANYIYHAEGTKDLKLLLRNYPFSDDIAFRFSNTNWSEHPLTAEKFSSWVHRIAGSGEIINLFIDYETFGEHQWEDKGIFQFLEVLPDKILMHNNFDFCTPCEAIERYPVRGTLNIPELYSWADIERDLTAWCGNKLQEDALKTIYALEKKVKSTGNDTLLKTWQSFLTSDHFYYMCTKWFSDGDVHKYFSPYESPYIAYINFQNAVKDFKLILG
ncbi:MAG: alpha-amylase [Gammaproteobacteria bacterium RIFCSPLOWO2_02_FULL_42_14]|nr:MAG: alpha-amylase [Gammaproteobacteria bacterium RIFCSPHIGHO2_02_FULL_42_43]OGT28232.1 MAG: alpha-amylase [Gammaproteobacteria bacterium RIFCSPHIGHO2_01_FULL_42_8]OGT52846.1 MAG: alpha-amylase [Gammaproteobacteria bacterium RIFCSPHIGHO2_12_FULL_41_25]OGT62552.1 MAG: alpha-amylase [Gammaproteobacteria bacterium RIFCSPLOWO2_02_FULL_42_14]OGT86535.1 MAG: alpha-amylase [Gammaproteobacteria bacterium RIFCSPLOWO2_12_FULL_42_18]